MWDHSYVEEVLREWRERELERRARLRHELASIPRGPSRPRRLVARLGRALIHVGMWLCGWGYRCRTEEVAAALEREKSTPC